MIFIVLICVSKTNAGNLSPRTWIETVVALLEVSLCIYSGQINQRSATTWKPSQRGTAGLHGEECIIFEMEGNMCKDNSIVYDDFGH